MHLSGVTVNVLPLDIGLELGAVWDDRRAILGIAGSLGRHSAIPMFATVEIDGLHAARLAFAWIKQSGVPLILGQTNFFMEFVVCFYRSQREFEIRSNAST